MKNMFINYQWELFCKELSNEGIQSTTIAKVIEDGNNKKNFFVLKHDVETDPRKALDLAKIENKYSHQGTYYVQGYLLNSHKNVRVLKEIQKLGHEVTYHHDVMDSNKGDLEKAKIDFEKHLKLFEKNGFKVHTVCQHGNPIIERSGYHSNRDFFRDEEVSSFYSRITEVMVNFKSNIKKDYMYISDAGYGWKLIFDPENNDRINSSHKDYKIPNLQVVIKLLKEDNSIIVSTHPHRWSTNKAQATIKNSAFKLIKSIAKKMMKVKIFNKLMSKFYFLAKKI